MEEGAEVAGPARQRWPLVLLGMLCLGVLYIRAVGVEHQYFKLSNQTSVETWSLKLPKEYRLEYWRYSPTSRAGGIRLVTRGGE